MINLSKFPNMWEDKKDNMSLWMIDFLEQLCILAFVDPQTGKVLSGALPRDWKVVQQDGYVQPDCTTCSLVAAFNNAEAVMGGGTVCIERWLLTDQDLIVARDTVVVVVANILLEQEAVQEAPVCFPTRFNFPLTHIAASEGGERGGQKSCTYGARGGPSARARAVACPFRCW